MLLVWNILVLSSSHFRVLMIDKLLASEVLDPSLIHHVQLQNNQLKLKEGPSEISSSCSTDQSQQQTVRLVIDKQNDKNRLYLIYRWKWSPPPQKL